MKIKKLILVFLSGLLLTSCAENTTELTPDITPTPTPTPTPDDTLTIWWNRSHYLQEDEALEAVIEAWQNKTGNKVSFYLISPDDILKDTVNALNAGNPPDILYASRIDQAMATRWAWDGKLTDVTDVVEPLKSVYSEAALQSVQLYNSQKQKRSIYAIPLQQRTVHIHYWRDLLDEAGFQEEDIPTQWDEFWQFWQQVQDNLRAKGRTEIYSFGFPMSSKASDTHNIFEHILDVYDVELLDDSGNLQLKNPQVRQRIIKALNWYTQFYKDGYVPQNVENWTNGSNNSEFINQNVVLTINPTLSIPSSQREDEEIYYNQMATIEFPFEPDGEPLKHIVSIKQIVLFESSPNKKIAKDFLSYLVQPENLSTYLEGSLGRYFPVMPIVAAKPFWNDPADPHISVANQQFKRPTRSGYQRLNPAYTIVQAHGIWGQALERMIIKGWSAEEAGDEAIVQIEEIFAQEN